MTMVCRIIKMKIYVAELGHSDLLPLYEFSFTKMPTSQEMLNRI